MDDKLPEAVRTAPPSHSMEVAVVEPEEIRKIRLLKELKWGSRRIADELGIARNTVRRYIRLDVPADAVVEQRPGARRLDADKMARAVAFFDKEAAGNAVVVHRLLQEAQGDVVSLRTVQRAVQPQRARKEAAGRATVRFETAPGAQLQIDFGEMFINIGGRDVKVHLFVACLGFSRRIFVRATTSERMQDWYDGVSGAFAHFGGVTTTILVDNAKALVLGREKESNALIVNASFAALCVDLGCVVKACAPYRARTKGKVESNVKYVKRNGIAGMSFVSFEALEQHLQRWMTIADARVHGTTRLVPMESFTQDEAVALQPLPKRPLPMQAKRLRRRVSGDCFVNVDDVRYSVPAAHVGTHAEVEVTADNVSIYVGVECIASHKRAHGAGRCVKDGAHFKSLYRSEDAAPAILDAEQKLVSRPLDAYEAFVQGGAR